MKVLISILVVLGVIFTAWKLFVYWEEVDSAEDQAKLKASQQISPQSLDGLAYEYERGLNDAKKKGATQLKEWLDKAQAAGLVKDPRLAWIELDYVILVAVENPLEAKKVYLNVKKRTSEDSPVYDRVKSLEKTFGP